MATKIDTIRLGTSDYEIDLKSTATPSIASLSTSGTVTVGDTLTVKGTSNLSNVICNGNITLPHITGADPDGTIKTRYIKNINFAGGGGITTEFPLTISSNNNLDLKSTATMTLSSQRDLSIGGNSVSISTAEDAITLSSNYIMNLYASDGISLEGETIALKTTSDILLNPDNMDYIRFKKGKSGAELSIQPNYLLKMSAPEYNYEVYFQILGPIKKFIDRGLSFTTSITGTPGEILPAAIGFGAPMHLVPICVYSSQDDAYYSGIFSFTEDYSGNMSITFRFPSSSSDILNMDLTRNNISMKLIQLS